MKAYTLIAALMLAVPVMAQQAGGSTRHGKAGCTVELLTDPEGVDFNSTLREVYRSVRDRWFANMPPDIEREYPRCEQSGIPHSPGRECSERFSEDGIPFRKERVGYGQPTRY